MTTFLSALAYILAGLAMYQGFVHLWRALSAYNQRRAMRLREEYSRWLASHDNPLPTVRELEERTTVKKEEEMAKMFRQGDVLLVRVKQIPSYAKEITEKDRIVLAYGEVTGHAHAIYPEVIEKDRAPELKAKLWDAGAERFLQVMEKTALRHEEHTAIDLDKGVYRVVRQREYDPVRDRYVAD